MNSLPATHGSLKPCPLCGSRAEVVHASHIRCVNTYNCDCETRLGPTAWNRRAPVSETPASKFWKSESCKWPQCDCAVTPRECYVYAPSATRARLPQHIKDFIDDRSDIRDGSDGPMPNDWMTLQQMIEEAE